MHRRMGALLILLVLGTAATLAFAADKNASETMSVNEIKSRVAEAQKQDRRLIINLKNGKNVSGLVAVTSPESFSLTHTHGPFGNGAMEMIRFADVDSVKGRNQFVKAIKDFGIVAGIAAALPVLIIVCLFSGRCGGC